MSVYNHRERVFTLRHYAYKALGWHYNNPGLSPRALNALRAYNMLYTRSGRFVSHGSVHGKGYDEQAFALADVTAPIKHNEKGQEIYSGFGGVVMSLDITKDFTPSFETRTIICRDQGRLNSKTVQDMKRVGLVDLEFERRFEVYSTDQVEARALVTPDFMERLIQFDDDYLGRNIQCAFIGGRLNICLEIDDRFDFNRLPLVKNYEAVRVIVLHETAAIFTVLELCQRLQDTIGVQTDDTMDKQRGVYYKQQLDIVKAALETPPESWDNAPKLDPNIRYSQFLFDGYLGDMVKSVYAPLGVPKPKF